MYPLQLRLSVNIQKLISSNRNFVHWGYNKKRQDDKQKVVDLLAQSTYVKEEWWTTELPFQHFFVEAIKCCITKRSQPENLDWVVFQFLIKPCLLSMILKILKPISFLPVDKNDRH